MRRPFRRRDALGRLTLSYGPSMTPMVDVVLVILIFFMASATLAGPEWFLDVALPKRESSDAIEPDPFALPPARFVVRLERGEDGQTVATGLGLEGASLERLEDRLEALVREAPRDQIVILFEVRDEAGYAGVVRACEACRAVGIEQVGVR
ncbi:MAG: biopolymer transporter ExbD [Phycisphaeraceae bacterium]|nr:biopolymer transporter ExbD [Phycisphaeraceae bacterium]